MTIDPGKASGYVTFSVSPTDKTWKILDHGTFLGYIDGFITILKTKGVLDAIGVVVVEDYIIRPDTVIINIGRVETLRLLGAIEFWASSRKLELILSHPNAKTVWTRERMKLHMSLTGYNRHERDALAHTFKYLENFWNIDFKAEVTV